MSAPYITGGVDPGKIFFGLAKLRDGVLAYAGHHTEAEIAERVRDVDDLAVEMPDENWGSTVNDIIHVARAAQRVITRRLYEASPGSLYGTEYAPRDWKASIKKWHHHRRIWLGLSDEERECFAACFNRSVEHVFGYIDNACCKAARSGADPAYGAGFTHALDALGIALFRAGLIAKTGVRK